MAAGHDLHGPPAVLVAAALLPTPQGSVPSLVPTATKMTAVSSWPDKGQEP